MIYMDLETLYRECDIPNNYILSLVSAARARQLSVRKVLGGDEKYISKAVSDVTDGKISYKIIDPLPKTENVPAA